MSSIGCNNCKEKSVRGNHRLFFCDCGHVLCEPCLARCMGTDEIHVCLICQERLRNPILMDPIQDEDGLIIDGRRRKTEVAVGGSEAPQQWEQVNLFQPGQQQQQQQQQQESGPATASSNKPVLLTKVTTVAVPSSSSPSPSKCECAVTSVAREITLSGRNQLVELQQPTYDRQRCEHCSGGGGGGAGGIGGIGGSAISGVVDFLGNVASATWRAITGK